MRVLVLQHIDVEHPGSFRDFMATDGIDWDPVELDAGEPIPPLDGYAAMLVMGGPMNVWDQGEHPWLVAEKRAIARWVGELGRPFLGVCLGHQLLADALGGRVQRMAAPEVGLAPVTLTAAAADDPLLAGLASPFEALHWHGCEVSALPADAVVLAGNGACPIQAMRVGRRAWGIQFHVEVTPDTVPEWGRIPIYGAALERTLGPGGQARLEAETAARLQGLTAQAKIIWNNFRRAL